MSRLCFLAKKRYGIPVLALAGFGGVMLVLGLLWGPVFIVVYSWLVDVLGDVFGPTYAYREVNRCDLYDRESSGIFNGTYSDGSKNWDNAKLPDSRCTHSITAYMSDKGKMFVDYNVCRSTYDAFVQETKKTNAEFCLEENPAQCRDALVMVPFEAFQKEIC